MRYRNYRFEVCFTEDEFSTFNNKARKAHLSRGTFIRRAIDTMEGKSCEGKVLTGKKLAIQLDIKQKILYGTDCDEQSVHAFCTDYYLCVYLTVPKRIEGTKIEYFIQSNRYHIIVNCEDTLAKILNKCEIGMSLTLFVKFTYTFSYELCYSQPESKEYSTISLAYADGSHAGSIITSENGMRIRKPLWSPNGFELAWILRNEGHDDLYISHYKRHYSINLTKGHYFKYIDSFCWAGDGRSLVFSACIDQVCELFSIEKSVCEPKQLTFGDGRIKSYKPVCSNCTEIFYLRHAADITNIWSIQYDGKEQRQVSDCGKIRNFDCSKNG